MFKKILFAGALLVGFATAYAQSSAPFGVTGTVTPGPCNVTLGTGGTASLGSVTVATVKGWTLYGSSSVAYASAPMNVSVSITCSAATKIGVAMVDNNPGKIIGLNAADAIQFGLVNGTGTSSIGSFSLNFTGLSVDSASPAKYLSAANGTTVWSPTSAAGTSATANFAAPGNMNSFTKTAAATTPEAFTTLTGNLAVSVYLNKTIVDTATAAITPTGSGTLTLVYL